MKLYKYRRYKKKYLKLFEKEKRELKRILPFSQIEHIGSTSIKGMGGKGVIDIIIGVEKKLIKISRKILINNNYTYKEVIDNRYFFIKEKGIFVKKRFHTHLTIYNNDIWKKALKFRDFLRKNKKAREKYSILKKHACEICSGEGKLYRKYKEDFIKKILNKKS